MPVDGIDEPKPFSVRGKLYTVSAADIKTMVTEAFGIPDDRDTGMHLLWRVMIFLSVTSLLNCCR